MTDSAVEDVEEESEIARARWENRHRTSRNGLQRRIDRLGEVCCGMRMWSWLGNGRITRERYRLRAENASLVRALEDLQYENKALKDGLERSLQLVDKLRNWRTGNG